MNEDQLDYPFPLLIIVGKGGVGRSVVTATLGTVAASNGHSTLVVEVGGQQQLPGLLSDRPSGVPDESGIVEVGESLAWVSFSPERLLAAWLSGRSMGMIADRLESSGALSVIASAIPGIKDALVLGKLRSLVDAGNWDRIIVDGPATGRAREMLRAPLMLAHAAVEGPIASQAERAHALITDPDLSAVLLVTLADETPVSETIESAFALEDDPGVRLAGLIVNRVFPPVKPPRSKHPAAPGLASQWSRVDSAIARLDQDLPLPRVMLPELPLGVTGPTGIAALAGQDGPSPTGEGPTIGQTFASESGQEGAIDELLGRDVVVTVGAGGVGKTSMGAAIATAAAMNGRNVALITIDPARRLADALGLDDLDDELRLVESFASGSLHAAMLDPRATFERVVRNHAPSPDQADAILGSPLSSHLADALSGMTEYMAVERLRELAGDRRFDLVVVDTPPSADALAFLDAPTLLARLLDNRIYRLLVHGGRRNVVGRALGGLVGQLVATVGGAVVRDAVAFFRNFTGMEEGFRDRAREIHELLRSPRTGVAVVVAPSSASLSGAHHFVAALRAAGVDPLLTIVNRITADPGDQVGSERMEVLLAHVRLRRRAELASLAAVPTDIPLVTVDELPTGVSSLADVRMLAKRFAGS